MSPRLAEADVPRRDPEAQAVALPDGRLLVRHRGGVSVLGGVDAAGLRRVLEEVDGRRTAGEIAAGLAGEYDPEAVLRLLAGLSGEMVHPVGQVEGGAAIAGVSRRAGPGDLAAPVAVVANGPAGRRIASHLGGAGLTAVRLLEVAAFTACRNPGFQEGEEHVLLPAAGSEGGEASSGDPPRQAGMEVSEGMSSSEYLAEASAADLARRLQGAALAVCALEGVPYLTLLEVQAAGGAAGLPVLFLTSDPDGLRLGPAVPAGGGPCLACSQLAGLSALGLAPSSLLAALEHFRTGTLSGPGEAAALSSLVTEVLALLGGGGEPSLAGEVLWVSSSAGSRRLPVERIPGCPACGGPRQDRPPALLGSPPPEPSLVSSPETPGHAPLIPAATDPESPGPTPCPDPLSGLPSPSGPAAAPSSSPPAPGPAGRAALRLGRTLAESLDRRPARAIPSPEGQVASVGILGGGTAGYLAALALRARLPHLAVTLIESPDVPVIGVGEATTPLMPQFLHVDLGLDVHQLFREVHPTFKLGIRFLWGSPGDGDFHYPFGPLHVVEPRVHGGDLRDCSLQGMLMTAGAVPLYAGEGDPGGEEDWACRLGTEIAYHLDNQRFVSYLERRAAERGIERVEATIARVELSADGEEVRSLSTTDGRHFAFDLYLDCTGFRSLLLEGALGSPWLSFASCLPTDRAVVAAVPHIGNPARGNGGDGIDRAARRARRDPREGGSVRPYTTAETMRCGWCWSTPQEDADHRGYVFASAWLGDAEAEEEMRRANPGMGEARLVRFRAGRHAHFWKGNVVALGNSYGFVEPLESTALHMLIRQIGVLVRSFPLRRGERGLQALHDRKVGAWWDYLRWFLALHYRFNRRLDTPFWRACHEDVDVSSHGELLAAFGERGPLSYDPAARSAFDYPDPLWGPEGIDVLLLGQGVPSPLPRPALDEPAWAERLRLSRALVARAAPHDRALAVLGGRPDLLERLAAAFRDAGPAFPVVRS